ncbi:MAG: tetratricopeptide repeat protein [Catenulispora sp.]|nr:tetratricopeptide repeat protein [Catenulispora sp.]
MSQYPEPVGALTEVAARAVSLEDVAALLRALRRRHARVQRDSALTYRELAARTGWSPAAIAEYFTARTLPPTDRYDALLDVLGAAPGELRALVDARDRAEETLRRTRNRRTSGLATPSPGGPAGSAAHPGRPAVVPRQLPADTALFTGRELELGHLLSLAEHAAGKTAPGAAVIGTIDGMGGVGKTALAVHAGHLLAGHFPDGQLLLDLHGFSGDTAPQEPGEALAGLLGALGVPPGQIPAQLEARAALYRERMAGTRTLVVLDNAVDEAQVRPLLPASAGCLVLVTSRRHLKALDDAVPLSLDMLAEQEAVALLRQAARVRDDPAQADDARWRRVAELCGWLPVALVIAGALLRTGGKAWDLQRLIDRLAPRRPGAELAGYTDDIRSLAAVFDLSYQSLSGNERTLYRRLGLLPGSELDAYAAAALLGADPDAADLLVQRLADQSLLIGVSPGRYRVHDLIRDHASTLAAIVDPELEREEARDRLLRYYAEAARRASRPIARCPRPALDGPAHVPGFKDPDAALAWLRAERPTVEAAFAQASVHGLDEHTIALAAGLAEILRADGPWTRAVQAHRTAAAAAERLGRPADQAAALADLGRVGFLDGDYPGAAGALTRALEMYRAQGDRHGEANALNDLGRVRFLTGDLPEAGDAHSRALEIYRGLGDRRGEANALNDLGRVRHLSGDFAGAGEAHTGALEIYRELGHRHGEANAFNYLGRVRNLTGDLAGADDAHSRALEIYRALGHRRGEANALYELGRVRIMVGDFAGAGDAQARALEISRALGYRRGEANAWCELGRVRQATGDHRGAVEAHTRALEAYRALDDRHGEACVLNDLGRVRQATGDHAGAVEAHTRALEIYRALNDRANEAWVLNYYAAAIAATGRPLRALALYHRALDMNRELNKPDDEANSLEGIGDHHLADGDVRRGTGYLRQALEIYERLGMRVDSDRVRARLDSIAAPDA